MTKILTMIGNLPLFLQVVFGILTAMIIFMVMKKLLKLALFLIFLLVIGLVILL